MTLGIPNTGSSGVIIALITFRRDKKKDTSTGTGDYVIGVMILIISLGFALAALMQLYILVKVHKFYRKKRTITKEKESLSDHEMETQGERQKPM